MSKINRRDFIKQASVLPIIGAASTKASYPTKMQYRTLGKRTGLRVSEIGFGGYPINDPDVLSYAIDHGINYIDTAPDYRDGKSEMIIGSIMKKRRDEVVLASKWHPWRNTEKKEILDSLDQSLKRLQTDHLDIIFVHQVGRTSGGEGKERLDNPYIYEAFNEAKSAGKVKHLGVSAHDGDLIDVMVHALKIDLFDVILCKYSFLDYPKQNELFQVAQEKGVGVVAMKSLAGARGENISKFQSGDTTYRQAALKWVLSNPNVSNLIISINTIKEVDEYVASAGNTLKKTDLRMLKDYENLYAQEVCRFCNECEPTCPNNKPIADILRYSMYFNEYHEEARAIAEIKKRNIGSSECLNCDAPCEDKCPYNVEIKKMLIRAQKTFEPYYLHDILS